MNAYTCQKCGQKVPVQLVACPSCSEPHPPMEAVIREVTAPKPEKRKRSVLLLISAILGIAYAIYGVAYWAGAAANASGLEAVGTGIATALVMPHMICAVLAAIFNALGWALNSRGFALTGAILYAVAAATFPLYIMFVIVQMILSFIGFARTKKSNG